MDFKTIRSHPVVVQSRDALEVVAGLKRATGTITIEDTPPDEATLTLLGVTYEWHSDPGEITDGRTHLDPAGTKAQVANKLAAVLEERKDTASFKNTGRDLLSIEVDTDPDDPVLSLTVVEPGSHANEGMVSSTGNVTVTGLSGGSDGVVGGLPALGTDETGQNTYEKVVDCPDRTCEHLIVFVETNGAIISLDGGTTDNILVPGDTGYAMDGLKIDPESEIHAKNAATDSNYANLIIIVW